MERKLGTELGVIPKIVVIGEEVHEVKELTDDYRQNGYDHGSVSENASRLSSARRVNGIKNWTDDLANWVDGERLTAIQEKIKTSTSD